MTDTIIEQVKQMSPLPEVWILTPCYNGQMYVQYVASIIQTIETFRTAGIRLTVEFCKNDSLVPRARNNLLARAMSDASMTHVMFIDADITWNALDIFRFLLHNKPIVGGIYPKKSYQWNKMMDVEKMLERKQGSILKDAVTDVQFLRQNLVAYNVNYGSTQLNVEKSLVKVRHLPTGFMMIRRDVVEKMQQEYAWTKYEDDVGFLREDEEKRQAYALFDCGVVEGHYYSEDWMFCHRWREIGRREEAAGQAEIYADLSTALIHTGSEDYVGFVLSTFC
jgi:hypothetical protein